MNKKKRKRSENWSTEDKVIHDYYKFVNNTYYKYLQRLLRELIKDVVDIIENKNTDTNSNNSKKKAWVELMEHFNIVTTGSIRTLPQLKSQWATLKMDAKKEVSTYRRELNKTGGGPTPENVSAESDEILQLIPNEFVLDYNEFDSDIQEATVLSSNEQSTTPGIEKTEIVAAVDLKKRKIQNPKKRISTAIEQIAEVDKELHEVQMENERKKSKLLDLKIQLAEEKLKSIKNI